MKRYPEFYAIVCKGQIFVVSPYFKKGKLIFRGLTSMIAMSKSCSFKEIITDSALTVIFLGQI